jgi:hypothetical protein
MARPAKGEVNKSEETRKVLQAIGAISETPPESWVDTTLETLAKKKIEIPPSLCYAIRNKEMQKAGFVVKTRAKRGTRASSNGEVSGGKLLKVKEMIDGYGSLENFEEQFGEFQKIVAEIGMDDLQAAISLLKRLQA